MTEEPDTEQDGRPNPLPSRGRLRYRRSGQGLEFDRVANFSDAVYAIALTLIAVELHPPVLEVEGSPTSCSTTSVGCPTRSSSSSSSSPSWVRTGWRTIVSWPDCRSGSRVRQGRQLLRRGRVQLDGDERQRDGVHRPNPLLSRGRLRYRRSARPFRCPVLRSSRVHARWDVRPDHRLLRRLRPRSWSNSVGLPSTSSTGVVSTPPTCPGCFPTSQGWRSYPSRPP